MVVIIIIITIITTTVAAGSSDMDNLNFLYVLYAHIEATLLDTLGKDLDPKQDTH